MLLFFGHPPCPQKTSVALCLYPWSIPSCKKSTHPRLEADAFIYAPDYAALHSPVQLATLSSFRWLQGGLPRHLQRLHHPRKARRCSHAIPLALLASFSIVSHHSSVSFSFALNTLAGRSPLRAEKCQNLAQKFQAPGTVPWQFSAIQPLGPTSKPSPGFRV